MSGTPRMHAIEANGVLHRVVEQGPRGGRTLVLSNSLGTDLTAWDAVVARLPAGLHILRYDTRGHGLSGLPPSPWTIEDCADDLAGILDALGIRAATVCGLSVGGLIAQSLASRRPDLVERLVLMDTAARIGTADAWAERIHAVEEGGIEAIADRILERWFSARFLASAPEVGLWRAMLARTSGAGYVHLCAAIRDADLSAATRRLTLPTLAIAGDEDGATPPETVAATAALIAGARFERLSGVGHLPPVETPETTAALLEGFIAEADGAPRHDAGMAVRRRVLGDAHVDRANAAISAFDADFQRFITEGAWGSVWTRPDISPRERSMITLALLAALGHWSEVAMHVRASRNTGASERDIAEAFLHVAVYAGVPAANHAFKIAKETLAEEDRS